MPAGVPLIDISPSFTADRNQQLAVAVAVDEACRKWGFLVVTGHGVPRELVANMERLTRAFFALPLEERIASELPPQVARRGYHRFANGANGRLLGREAPPDLRESFRMGPEPGDEDSYYLRDDICRFYARNVWPERLPEMRIVWERYYRALDGLARRLMRIFADALDLPRDWFQDSIDRPATELVSQYYPPLTEEPLPGQFRNHAHTDFGNITILKAEDRPSGLQVLGLDEDWHEVVPVADSFVVNIGDMLAQWTNDRWRSTMHRVVNPPQGNALDRLSIAFFHEPNPDARIATIPSCISDAQPQKYADIRAGTYMAEKLDLIQGYGARAF
jgi:isopenicillin N synthase-like dioxygenase